MRKGYNSQRIGLEHHANMATVSLFCDSLFTHLAYITNCVDSLFFFDYCELIMTSSNAH